ncbi:MAG: HNH endonuclease signature motif containing protein [Pseudomonadota bacterium]
MGPKKGLKEVFWPRNEPFRVGNISHEGIYTASVILVRQLKKGKIMEEWKAIIEEYFRFQQMKSWVNNIEKALKSVAAEKEKAKLIQAIEAMIERQSLPKRPEMIDQDWIDTLIRKENKDRRNFDKSSKTIKSIWRALIYYRDKYTCEYCERDIDQVLNEIGVTLRLQLDHRNPKSISVQREDFDLTNIATSCKSCNTIKGKLDREKFVRELNSLAKAVMGKQQPNTWKEQGHP